MTSLLEARSVAAVGRLRPTNVAVEAGELVAVIGPNGGGKTSLLRALADIGVSTGDVRIAGEALASLGPSRRPYVVTYLPASRDLVWPISVRDIIALGMPRPDPDRIEQLIELMELGPMAVRDADRLSTGERARVLLARALAPRPRVLLLDEPLSNLDPYWVLRILDILRDATSNGTSALVALHDIERLTAFDRALLIANGEICADLLPEDMLRAQSFAGAFRIERGASGWEIRR